MALYVFWSKFLLIELIPYLTIVVCNVFIINKITKSARFRRRFDNTKEEGERSAAALRRANR